MADKDQGSHSTTEQGGMPPQKQTGATDPGHPNEATKPNVKNNDPSAKGPPRGSGHRG
jgi:hypothetical protein